MANELTKNLNENVQRIFGKTNTTIRKNAPTILTIAGVGAMVAGTIFAVKATAKVEPIIDICKQDIENLKRVESIEIEVEEGEMQKVDVDAFNKRAAMNIYIKTAGQLAKLYWPTVALTIGGAACILGAHNIISARYGALATSYGTLKSCYDGYRDRVKKELGDEKEEKIFYGIETVPVKEKNEETGKLEKKEMDIIPTEDPIDVPWYSPYARRWNSKTAPYVFNQRDPEVNKMTLEQAQVYFTEKLRVKGSVFLNEVYDVLGLSRTPEGQLVGWVFGGDGDDFVDLGCRDVYWRMNNGEGLQAFSKEIFIDPNVNGLVYDLL